MNTTSKTPIIEKGKTQTTGLVEIVFKPETNLDFVQALVDGIKEIGQNRVSILIDIEDIRGFGPIDSLFNRLRAACALPVTFNRCALLEDSPLIINLARLADRQFPSVAIRGFHHDEITDARRWVSLERRSV